MLCLLLSIFLHNPLFAQRDTLAVQRLDTVSIVGSADSSFVKTDTFPLQFAQSEVNEIITYQAEDSIVYDLQSRKMYLYQRCNVRYGSALLEANQVWFDWDSATLTAQGSDSAGIITGKPVFTEGGKPYRSTRMRYNFKTQRGMVYEAVTQEGDAYLYSAKVKRNEDENWFGERNRYTTCDLEHPHFYFRARKIKVVPEKVMVTGPASIWVGDVPLPIGVPFALFPVKKGRRSGVIVPQYGEDASLGFFLREGGYFWAVNERLAFKFTTLVSTNGTFGASVGTQYNWRYRFNGQIDMSYVRNAPANPDLPGAKARNDFKIRINHTQDPKFLPNASLTAAVEAQTASFYNSSGIRDQQVLQTTFYSTIAFSYTIPRTPFRFNINVNHNQNLLNRTISFTLPTFGFYMSRITPFKPKISSEKPRWYENIGIAYSLEAKNVLQTYDSILFRPETRDRFQFGVVQRLAIDAPIRVLKYINVNPAVQYSERSYVRYTTKRWQVDTIFVGNEIDTLIGRVVRDTIRDFTSARDMNASVNINTKITGIFNFRSKWIKALRHEMTPQIGFTYAPDVSAKFWNNYGVVQRDFAGNTEFYNRYEGQLNGPPAPGQSAALTFGLLNNFELKTYSKKDSVNHEQKIPILRSFNITGSYNFAADSLRLGDINISGNTELWKNLNMRFNMLMSPYAVNERNQPINQWAYNQSGQLLRFKSATVGLGTMFRSKPRKTTQPQPAPLPAYVSDYVSFDPDDYYDFDIPWSVGIDYNFNLTRGTFTNPDTFIISQAVSANIDFNLTPKWKFNVRTGYDFQNKALTYTTVSVVRDLHCWELTFNWTAFPLNLQQFLIEIRPKSGTLRDLKLTRRRQLLQEF